MVVDYWFILCLLEVLLLTNWIQSASLHHSLRSQITDHQNSSLIYGNYSILKTPRRTQSPLAKKQKVWIQKVDHDKIETALDKFLRSLTTHTNTHVSDAAMPSTVSLYFQTKESKPSMIESFDDLFNATKSLQVNMTIPDSYSNESVITYDSLFQQNFTESHQSDDRSHNTTDVRKQNDEVNTLPTEQYGQTTDKIDSSTSINLAEDTTTSDNATDNNQTIQWGLLFNDKTETILYNDSSTITINDTLVINSNEIIGNTEKLNFNQSAFLSLQSTNISICDHSCQCLQKCPYDFEIINNTCLCYPPCQHYQCFGNDTCNVTDDGKPRCQSTNGNEHVRPIRCYQPRHSGYHDSQIEYYNRWYFDPDQNACHLFVYRGLGGNENNFKTLRECHLECIICGSLPDPGDCFGHHNMWFYDKKQQECRQFEYSGCKGNENKFSTEEQCIQTCTNPMLGSP